MAETSTRQRIIDALVARLAAINGAPPFQTQLGSTIFLGEFPGLGPDDPAEALVVLPDTDTIVHQRANILSDWPIIIGAVARSGPRCKPWPVIEAAIADIKRAIELEDRYLGIAECRTGKGIQRGATQVFERPAGAVHVGAGVTYTVPYIESWGTP